MSIPLIIRSSQSRLADGSLKSNLGDLLRTTIILENLGENFLWLCDHKAKEILQYFLEAKRICTFDDFKKSCADKEFTEVINLDNFITDVEVARHLKVNWRGFKHNRGVLQPENEYIASTVAYSEQVRNCSWQEDLIRGLGYTWQEQDYAKPKIAKLSQPTSFDIGLNHHVHADWASKHWPVHYWEELFDKLSKQYTLSWQSGMNNLGEYIAWINSCRLIITCDSFGLHLASALRKKVVAIVGPIQNREYYYDRVSFVEPSARPCMPCNKPKCFQEIHCLAQLNPGQVDQLVRSVLERYAE